MSEAPDDTVVERSEQKTVRGGGKGEAPSPAEPARREPPTVTVRRRRALGATYWVTRRELHALVRAPLLYVLGGGFLAVQGIAFAALVSALSDPQRPAPVGALLEGQLGGSLLTWVLGLAVLALLGMRAIAEDRRAGTWELLLTAQVSEANAVIGKWLAATVVYALLWIPTLAYLAVVAIYRADATGWDVGAIVSGYVGAIAIGAALLAWAIAASAATSSLLVAGGLAFALLLGFLLVGEVPALWPGLATEHPTLASAFGALSLRGTAMAFARGEVTASAAALLGGLAVTGLSLAIALAGLGRRRASEVRTRLGSTIVLAVIAVLLGILALRHPLRWDVSDRARNTLDPATSEALAVAAASGRPLRFTIVRPTLAGVGVVYEEVDRVAQRMREIAPIQMKHVDPAEAPGGLAAIARAAGLTPTDLAAGGAVIVEVGDRRRVVDLLAIASIARGPGDAPTVESLAIEQALVGALVTLTRVEDFEVCATIDNGELSLEEVDPNGADWTTVAARLRGDGMLVRVLSAEPDIPRTCRVVLVAGPLSPLAPERALAIQSYVQAGGALVVAAASRPVPTTGALAGTGLGGVLAADGLGLSDAIVVDRTLAMRDVPGALYVVDGYASHPINMGFPRARAIVWYQPRAVVVQRGAGPLVSASRTSWGELDLVQTPKQDVDDLAGPVALAALGRSGRVVALGSAESLSGAVLGGGASAGDLWLLRAVRFAGGALDTAPGRGHAPEQVRLVLSAGDRSAIVILCAGLIPLAWTVGGGLVLLVRRRRLRRSE